MVRLLLEKGLSPTMLDGSGDAPIHLSLEGLLDSEQVCKATVPESLVQDSRMKALVTLCTVGKSVNLTTGDNQLTPLHRAIKPANTNHFCEGQFVFGRAIAIVLLKNGADPSARDISGHTAFHMAATVIDPGFIKLIANSPGVDINAVTNNKLGDSALHIAVREIRCHCHTGVSCLRATILSTLILVGVNKDARNRANETALHLLVNVPQGRPVCEVSLELMLTSGARIDIQDYFGSTPIHLAAENRQEEVLRLLLKYVHSGKKGTEVLEMKDHLGRTPWACVKGKGKKKIIGILSRQFHERELEAATELEQSPLNDSDIMEDVSPEET